MCCETSSLFVCMLSAHKTSQGSALAIARAHSTQPEHTKSPNSPRSSAHRAYICRKRRDPLALLFGATALRRGWASGREVPLSRVWACATPWSAVMYRESRCELFFVVCYARCKYCSGDGRLTHSLHVPRGSERDMEMGMSWATPISVRGEKRRGQSALPAPLASANFQTSFNLI